MGSHDASIAAMTAACQRGRLFALEELIELVDPPHWAGPAMAAIRQNHDDCLRLLLARGLSPDARDDDGRALVMVAARHDRVACLRLLLDAGASLETRSKIGWSAIHFAVDGGSPECLSMLLAQGADPGARANGGLTAAALGAAEGKLDCLRILAERGVDFSQPLRVGTPARATRLDEIAQGEPEALAFILAQQERQALLRASAEPPARGPSRL